MRVEGLDEVMSTLLRSAGPEADQAASEAVGRVAQDVKKTAVSLAPQGPTGDLKRSIRVSVARSRTSREVGSELRYAGFVEYGTWKDTPQPYMGPAADQHEDDLVREMERVVETLWAGA